MDYVQKLLAANEQILFRAHRHWFVLFSSVFKELFVLIALIVAAVMLFPIAPWSVLVFGGLAVLVLISMLIDVARWNNQEFLVTNRRVIHASGIFNKSIMDSSLSKINDVILTQSWLGRVFNYGTIKILTATDEVINLFDRIRRPIELKRAMLDAKSVMEGLTSGPAASQSTATQLLEELASLKSRNMVTEEEYQEKRKEILKRM